MRSLRLPIDGTDFEQLAQLGRSMIPSVAPGWTDHNAHDPGIMLLELLAWIADAQIYSLSRLRRDERLAYARLLGVALRGPVEARGLIWPAPLTTSNGAPQFPWPTGHVLARGTPVTSADPNAPAFYTTDDIELISATLDGLHTAFADGRRSDWTAANAQDDATFMPFGDAPALGDRLVLRFKDARASADPRDAVVSIGVQIAAPAPPGAVDAGEHGEAVRQAGRLRVFLQDSSGVRPLEIVKDTTAGLLRSGVLLLRVRGGDRPVDASYTVSLRSASGAFLRPPRVQQIAPNVLSIDQIEAVSESAPLDTGLPNQTYQLKRPDGLMFPFGEGQFVVHVHEEGGSQEWLEVDDLQTCGPDDQRFELDRGTGILRFGNGINGRSPRVGSVLQVGYRVTAGVRGNLPSHGSWTVRGLAGHFGTNREATTGGADARGLAQLRALARRRVREARPIVTSKDLALAALAFVDLGVTRAWELESGGDRRVVGSRVLVVVGPHRAGATGPPGTESMEFLTEVRERLSPRLALGQRLEVIAPRYVPLRIIARLVAAPRVEPMSVREKVRAELRTRLAIVGDPPGGSQWPFGRDVTPLAVKGWLRNVEGVSRVTQVTLVGDGRAEQDGSVRLGVIGLPLLQIEEEDIGIERAPQGARR